jgi:predicted aspartyl protease
VSPAEGVAAFVARVRAALRFDEARAANAELRAQGSGMVAGLPATVTWQCHVDWRVRLEVASQLPDISAFDGVRGTHVGPSGLLEPLDLADLDELRMASAFFTGAWLDPRTPIVFDRVTRVGDTLVVGARVGAEEWRQPFRIVCAADSFHPTRLETLSGDGAVFEVGDFTSGVFCDVPRRLTWRRGWLVDTVEIAHVDPAADPSAYLLHDIRGDRAARLDPIASPRARVTRSPRGRLPLARASIDGRDVGWFLLDTGAGGSAIETAVADDLGLPALGRTWVVTPTGGVGAGYRRCQALTIGPLTLPQALLIELDLALISTALGVRLAGIIGFDLFAQAVVRLEHRQPLVVELFAPERERDRPGRWHDIRFEHRVPVLAARLPSGDNAASTGLMSLDTGSSAPLVLHERFARRLALMPRTTRQGVRGVSGAGSAGVRTLPWIEVGERFERVRTVVAETAEGTLASRTTLGSVGWGLFAGRGLLLDWPRRRLAILGAR